MSREIKFRFWSTILRKFVVPLDDIFVGALKGPDMAVMQYTGLHDKNGVDIYEGDIVRLDRPESDPGTPIVADIQYMPEMMSFVASHGDEFFPFAGQTRVPAELGREWREWLRANDYRCHMAKVIGNIYENPDLLEVKS